jgi:hypothetical protein
MLGIQLLHLHDGVGMRELCPGDRVGINPQVRSALSGM